MQLLDTKQVLSTVDATEKALRVRGTDRFDRESDVRYNIFNDPAIKPERWTNYTFTGRFKTTGDSDAVGFTVFSPSLDAPEQGYVIRVTANHPTFVVEPRPYGVTQLGGNLDSGFKPSPGAWTQFKIVAQNAAGRTEIRAKFWLVGPTEPSAPQIAAFDDSEGRARSGTVGVWAVNGAPLSSGGQAGGGAPGAKPAVLVTSLQVLPLTSTYFSSDLVGAVPSVLVDPKNWRDTAGSFTRASDPPPARPLFQKTATPSGKISLSIGIAAAAQTTFDSPDVLSWSNYYVTGRMKVDAPGSTLGVAFLSRNAEIWRATGRDSRAWALDNAGKTFLDSPGNRYYCLSFKTPNSFGAPPASFQIEAHPDELPDSRKWPVTLTGQSESELVGERQEWYRFRIRVEDTGSATHIQASVWIDGAPPPKDWQIDCFDNGPLRLTSGGVGVVSTGPNGFGSKTVEELDVQPIVLLDENFSKFADGAHPPKWSDTVLGTTPRAEPGLFHVANSGDNSATWRAVDDYPLVLHPLDRKARLFDGVRQYAAGVVPAPFGSLASYTVEAWVRPYASDNLGPVLSVASKGQDVFTLRLVPEALKIAPGEKGPFAHVALAVDEKGASVYVNGEASTWQPPVPFGPLAGDRLSVGRGSDGHCFAGAIKDVRIWRGARSVEQIQAMAFQDLTQVPGITLTDLVAYWPLGSEQDPEKATELDFSPSSSAFWRRIPGTNGGLVSLRLGGAPGDRFPILEAPPKSAKSALLQPAKMVTFKAPGDALLFPGDPRGNQPGSALQRLTAEVWFRVTDKFRTDQKQVVFQTGDGNAALLVYVFGGQLYYWGYNRSGKGPGYWDGTWLKTDRVGAGRWHHVAVVLDGRKEVRADSFRAFLDGKPLNTGPGAQLTSLGDASHVPSFSIGGAKAGEHYDSAQLLLVPHGENWKRALGSTILGELLSAHL